ncbi:glycosyltransferase family 4 protein [Candidatus Saccharibacteria bacterium TM7i]|nr:glycosyltransferase family 4 protein [Candidatus Saccharibacteria bacterium TM7i]
MKIVYVINSIKNSGPNQVVEAMVNGISDRNDVIVVAFFGPNDSAGAERLRRVGAKVVVLGVSKRHIITKGTRRLRAYLEGCGVSVIHSHGILSDIAVARSGFGQKALTTIHNNMPADYKSTFGPIKGLLYTTLHLLYLRRIRLAVCCSKDGMKAIRPFVRRVTFIHNGYGSESTQESVSIRDEIRATMGIKPSDRVYLYIGRLSKRKNIKELILNFRVSRSANEHLIIVGDGEEYEYCVENAGDGIHVVGFKDNVEDYHRVSDVYVSASLSEGFSISIIEALSKGLYLLLSDIPSHREVIDIDPSKYIGTIFSNGNFSAKKDELVKSMGTRLTPVNYHQKYLTQEVMMRQYEKLYKGVL